MNKINSFADLQPGKLYNVTTKRYNVTHKCQYLCDDYSPMNRPITYWLKTDKPTIIDKAKFKQMMKDNTAPVRSFAMWEHEIKMGTYEITEIETPAPITIK